MGKTASAPDSEHTSQPPVRQAPGLALEPLPTAWINLLPLAANAEAFVFEG